MAFNEELASILRKALSRTENITEKKMFGGLCFLWNGNMLCGIHQEGGMARVGKENEQSALMIPGVSPLSFTGRKMGGMVDVTADAIADAKTRRAVLKLAKQYVGNLPAK